MIPPPSTPGTGSASTTSWSRSTTRTATPPGPTPSRSSNGAGATFPTTSCASSVTRTPPPSTAGHCRPRCCRDPHLQSHRRGSSPRPHSAPGARPPGPHPVARGSRRPSGRSHHLPPARRHPPVQPVVPAVEEFTPTTCSGSTSTASAGGRLAGSARHPPPPRAPPAATGYTTVAVHSHPRFGTVWADLARLPGCYDQSSALGGGELVIVDEYDGPVNSRDSAARAVTAMGTAELALLVNHGVFVTAGSIRAAHQRPWPSSTAAAGPGMSNRWAPAASFPTRPAPSSPHRTVRVS